MQNPSSDHLIFRWSYLVPHGKHQKVLEKYAWHSANYAFININMTNQVFAFLSSIESKSAKIGSYQPEQKYKVQGMISEILSLRDVQLSFSVFQGPNKLWFKKQAPYSANHVPRHKDWKICCNLKILKVWKSSLHKSVESHFISQQMASAPVKGWKKVQVSSLKQFRRWKRGLQP